MAPSHDRAIGEGEPITWIASYTLPSGTPGTWVGSTYVDTFNGVNETLIAGSVSATLDGVDVTADVMVNGGSGGTPLSLQLDGIESGGNIDNSGDRTLVFAYSTTATDAALGGDATGSLNHSSTLTLAGGGIGGGSSGACVIGDDASYTATAQAPIARVSAAVGISGVPATLDVCQEFPATLNLAGSGNATGELPQNILTQLLDTGAYEFVSEEVASRAFTPAPATGVTFDGAAANGPTWELAPISSLLGSGTIVANVRLKPGTATGLGSTPLRARIDYDDNQTFIGGAGSRALSSSSTSSSTLVRSGDLKVTVSPQTFTVSGGSAQWVVYVTNTGDGVAFGSNITDTLPSGLIPDEAATNAANTHDPGDMDTEVCTSNDRSIAVGLPGGNAMIWELGDMQPGESCRIVVVTNVESTANCAIPDDSNTIDTAWGCGGLNHQQITTDDPNFAFLQGRLQITHLSAQSAGNMCGVDGQVVLIAENVGGSDLFNVSVREALDISSNGLSYVGGSTEYCVLGSGCDPNNAAHWAAVGDPAGAGTSGDPLVWDETLIAELAHLAPQTDADIGNMRYDQIRIRFNISVTEAANAATALLESSGTASRACGDADVNSPGVQFPLIINRPDIVLSKQGKLSTEADTEYRENVLAAPGSTVDWRVLISNSGQADAQHVDLTDVLPATGAGNYTLTGSGHAGTSQTTNIAVGIADIPAAGSLTYILSQTTGAATCVNGNNTASVVWGCGTTALSTPTDNSDSAALTMLPVFGGSGDITQTFNALGGGRTEIVIAVRNSGAGTSGAVALTDTLPAGFRLDSSFTPVLNSDGTVSNPGNGGSATVPGFSLGPINAGKTATLTFRVYPTSTSIWDVPPNVARDAFDNPETTVSGFDPTFPSGGNNQVQIDFSNGCGNNASATSNATLDPATPDLDISVNPNQTTVSDGEQVVFTFTIANNGDAGSIAERIRFFSAGTDGNAAAVGTGWTLDQVTVTTPGSGGSGGNCTIGGGQISCSEAQLGSLTQGAGNIVIQVTATAGTGGPLTLLGQVEGETRDGGGTTILGLHSQDQARPRALGFQTTKTLVGRSQGTLPDTNVLVGESLTWRLTAQWFGGDRITSATVRDSLPAGLAYLSHQTRPPVVGAHDVVISGGPGVMPGSTGILNFTLQDAELGDGIATFEIDLVTRVRDIAGNDGGAGLTNNLGHQFDASFGGTSYSYASDNAADGFGGSDAGLHADSSVNVDRPDPSITKQMAVAAGTPADAINAEAGDTLTVTLTWTNDGNAGGAPSAITPGYACVVSDVLDANLFDTAALNVAADVTPAGWVFDYDEPSRTVTYTSNPDSADCMTGASVSASFTAKVKSDVITATLYTNSARVDTDTLPTDAANPDIAQDINAQDSSTVTIGQAGSLGKLVESTSEDHTDPGDGNRNNNPPLAIGEVVQYALTFRMPEGTTNAVILGDDASAGFSYVAGSATLARSSTLLTAANDLGGINSAMADTPVNVDAELTTSGTELRLGLGNVGNIDTDTGTDESYTLRLRMVVANSGSNNAGSPLTNTGRLRFENAGGTQFSVDTDTRNAHVAEPQVGLTKALAPTSADAGDEVTYTLTITNTADPASANASAAFDWTFQDTLPAALSPVTTSIVSDPGTTGASISASFTGQVLNGTIDRLDPGESVTVSYRAQVDADAGAGSVIQNAARADATSVPGDNGTGSATPGAPGTANGKRIGSGGINDHRDTDQQDLTIGSPGITKVLENAQSYYAIGEEAEFLIQAGITGATNAVVVSDTLPDDLTYVGGSLNVDLGGMSVTNTPANEANGAFFSISGNVITFDFGDVTTADAANLSIRFRARVDNVPANQDGTLLQNNAALIYDDPVNVGNRITVNAANPPEVRVGEPLLSLDKAVVGTATNIQAGDTLRWRIVIANNSANSHTTAYQLELTEVLPDGLSGISNISLASSGNVFLNGSTTTVTLAHAHVETTLNAGDTLNLARAAEDGTDTVQVAPGASLTLEFDSVVMASVTPDQTLDNRISLDYASQPSGDSGSGVRDNNDNGDDSDDTDLNNYGKSASQAISTDAFIAVDKTVSPAQATIGGSAAFTITLSVIEGTTPGVTLTDILPPGFFYTGHQISLGNTGMSLTNAGFDTCIGSACDDTGQTVSFELGDIINPGNGSSSDDFVRIRIDVQARNITANQDQVVWRNGEEAGPHNSQVFVDWGAGQRDEFDADATTPGLQGIPLTIVEPDLQVTKTASPTDQALGKPVTYTVNVQHTGDSAYDAQDLVLIDTLPAGLTYISGSASLPAADVSLSGPQIIFRIDTLTLMEGSREFTYQSQVDPGGVPGSSFTNDLDLTWNSLSNATGAANGARTGDDGAGGALNDYASGDSATITSNADTFVYAPKSVTLANGDPATLVQPGEILRYTIEVRNLNGPVTGVVLTDPVPSQTTYVTGSLSSSPRGTPDASDPGNLRVAIGDMDAGDIITVTFQVTVDANTPNGAIIINQGTLDSDQTIPELTDGDGIPGNGNQPNRTPVGTAPPGSGGDLYVHKSVLLVSDADSSSDVTPGDTLRYNFSIRNTGSVNLTNVGYDDSLPNGLTPVPASATVTGSGNSIGLSGNALAVTIPSLVVGAVANASVEVIIDTPLFNSDADSTRETFVNQGSVDSDQTDARPSDASGDPGDGYQPTTIDAVDGAAGAPALDVQKRWSLAVDNNGDGVVNPGETLEYSLSVVNSGAGGGTPDAAIGIGKTLTATSETDTAGSALTIGEVGTFQVGITLQAGTLAQVNLIDNLPPGLTYLGGSSRLRRDFDTGLNASANPGGINSAASGVFVNLSDGTHISVGTNSLALPLGTVINSDNDANTEGYVLEFQALVANIEANQAGIPLDNQALANYRDQLNQQVATNPVTAGVQVVEPQLTLIKTSDLFDVAVVDSLVTFTLLIGHPDNGDNSPARDVRITDTLAAPWQNLMVEQVIQDGDISGVSYGTSVDTFTLEIDRMAAGATLTVVYTALSPSGQPGGSVLMNDAALTWTSLTGTNGSGVTPGAPGSANGERTGTGGVNDYTLQANVALPVRVSIPTLTQTGQLFLLLLLLALGARNARRDR